MADECSGQNAGVQARGESMTALIRDMDLIRNLLLKIEKGERSFSLLSEPEAIALGLPAENVLSCEEASRMQYHLGLLEDAKFITKTDYTGGTCVVDSITWDGHEFLDSIRDNDIWNRTKIGAKAVGSGGVDILKALAKGYIKKQIEEKTGVILEL
jgi:hypothetical protein